MAQTNIRDIEVVLTAALVAVEVSGAYLQIQFVASHVVHICDAGGVV